MKNPVRIPSGKYEKTYRVERMQQDLINEMAQTIADLPRFRAYAKLILESGGKQDVLKRPIATLPVPSVARVEEPSAQSEIAVKREMFNRGYLRLRENIEEELCRRRGKWRTYPRVKVTPRTLTEDKIETQNGPPPTRF